MTWAAAILVIVFGQHIGDVIRLTRDDVAVTVRLGRTPSRTPLPLGRAIRELAAAPGNDQTVAHPNSNCVFRGYSPRPTHRRVCDSD